MLGQKESQRTVNACMVGYVIGQGLGIQAITTTYNLLLGLARAY